MRIVQCRTCNKELINRRSHIQTCSSSCRSKLWRASKLPMVSVKLMFTTADYHRIEDSAETNGLTIDNYIHARALATEYRA
jgi:ribosomal protein L37AE/L43A